MLRWHYRSRHQSLIAVSNREFYENQLFIVPSPYDAVAGMGLQLPSPDGRRLRPWRHADQPGGGEGDRRGGHARTPASNPEQTLGVAAFSVAQRQAIREELELLRRANPDVEAFFAGEPREPFFVKNLENIQGDERDVIFISVGYGRTADGYLAMNFGPLSGEGGERRLNVLISRARLRCEVFSNLTGRRHRPRAIARRGRLRLQALPDLRARPAISDVARSTGADLDSEFEDPGRERAARPPATTSSGRSAPRASSIDLAVVDPDKPGRYLLGIECDGAAYPLLAIGPRPRPAPPAGPRGPRLDHPPGLEHRLVPATAKRAEENRGRDRRRASRVEHSR